MDGGADTAKAEPLPYMSPLKIFIVKGSLTFTESSVSDEVAMPDLRLLHSQTV